MECWSFHHNSAKTRNSSPEGLFPQLDPLPSLAVRAYHMGSAVCSNAAAITFFPSPVAVTRRGTAGSPYLHPFLSVMKALFPDTSISAESIQGPAAHLPVRCPSKPSLTSAMGAHSSFNFSIKELNKESGCPPKPAVGRQCLLPRATVVSDSQQK